jgi:RNA polymerase sigma-70 factor (ECF subfamily)
MDSKLYEETESCLKELFNKMKQGDIDAFVSLVSEYSQYILCKANGVCRNKDMAGDIVQDVLTKILVMDKSNYPITSPFAWLMRITVNTAISAMRKRKPMVSWEAINQSMFVPDHEPSTENLEEEILEKVYIEELLNILDALSKQIVIYKDVYGWKHKRIALKLEIPESTVRWKYILAHKRLTEEFGMQSKIF